jgi:hypothetical protein
MAVDLTLRLVKGSELTFSEIDNNWQLLDHAIDSNDSYYKGQISNLDSDLTVLESKFDSNLDSAVNKIIRDHDSDMDALLQEHDSDINWLLTNGTARHDSEHAWNVQEHARIDSDIRLYIDSSLGEVVGGLTIDSVPPDASEGEMWLDTTKDQVYINDGDVWFEFPGPSDVYGIMLVSDSSPTNPVNGTLWLDTVDDTVKIYDGDVWFEFPYPDQSLDSAFIERVIDSGYISSIVAGDHWDSAATISLVDSAYVQARQVDIYRDSAFVTNIVDSDYLASYRPGTINGGTY